MVLEKTVRPRDVEKIVTDAFGKNNVSLVITDDTIILTRVVANRNISDLAKASENALAKDWLSPEEDEAWSFL